ncbi:MAG: uncharacterized protein KVP18_000662 [Porospora cf. gigantea A]|uniref:uncharacterized protein n=1 Tax=Porospora cf. gigantea A TaxID=2853593 RepID=UPI00355A6049|nr:MAG: hypothetical protein KVP18_000662 [Porospora cf. gigantea A]
MQHHGERLWEQNAARPDAHMRSSRVIHVLLAVRHLPEADDGLRQHAAKAFELLPLQWRAREAPPRGTAFPIYQAPFPVYPRPGVFVPRCVAPRPVMHIKPSGPSSPAISLYSASPALSLYSASPALSLYSAHPYKQGSNLSSLARQVVDSDASESPGSPHPGQPLRRHRPSSIRPSAPRRWSGAGLETFPIPDLLAVGCRKHPLFIPPASPQNVEKVPRPQLEVWAQTKDIGPRIRKALFKLAQKKTMDSVG